MLQIKLGYNILYSYIYILYIYMCVYIKKKKFSLEWLKQEKMKEKAIVGIILF